KHLPAKSHLQEDTEDEGLEADRSLSLTPSPSSTLSSHASSTYSNFQREIKEGDERSKSFSKLNNPLQHIKNCGYLANNYHINKEEIFNNDYYEIIKHFNNNKNYNNRNHIDNRLFNLYSSDENKTETSNVNLNYIDRSSSPANGRMSLLSRFQNFSLRKHASHKSQQDLTNSMGQRVHRDPRSRSLDRYNNENQFARNRVSIPPTSRNRDRKSRPESFRLANDMASHTRVLLKTRSFASSRSSERSLDSPSPSRMNGKNTLKETQKAYQHEFEKLPVNERLPVIKRRAPQPPKPMDTSLATKLAPFTESHNTKSCLNKQSTDKKIGTIEVIEQ
ncbi:unnamed protein product, partial [Meganyctiphanes norvegica]